jgi:hypothetical protein
MQNFRAYGNPFWEKSYPGRKKERERRREKRRASLVSNSYFFYKAEG